MNKNIGISIVVLMLIGFGCSQNSTDIKIDELQVNNEPQEIVYDIETTEYFIEGKEVTKELYDNQRNQLVKIEDTYHCAKTTGGGRNWYEATDTAGVVWLIRCELNNNYTKLNLSKE